MNRRKVLFIYCYSPATLGSLKKVGGSHPPIGLLYPAAMLEKEGHEVRISDELVGDDSEKIIKEFRPDVLCLSVNTINVPRAKSLVDFGKQHGATLFIAGGAHATSEPESCIKDVGVNASVISEGEAVLPDLLRNDDWVNVKGVVYKNEEGNIINNGKRSLIQDLDSLPFPARHLIDFKKYAGTALFGRFLRKDEQWTPVITSRGCPFLCTFCANWQVMGRNTRDRSPENVVEELKEIKYKYGISVVDFLDDTFTLRPARIKKLCELIIKEKLNIRWSCQTRVTLTKDLVQIMKDAGCDLIMLGIESGSNKVLRAIKKGINIDMVKSAFKICREVGIRTKALFMVGTPGEESEDFEMSVKLLKDIKPDYLWVSKFTPLPGSEYYEKNREELKDMKWEDYNYFFGKKADVVNKRHKKMIRGFYLSPTFLINFLKRFTFLELIYLFKMFTSFRKM